MSEIDVALMVELLTEDDWQLANRLLKGKGDIFKPDVIVAPEGTPSLYRWHLVEERDWGNVFLHIQVQSDPERPLHDHPWDNQSVILSGGYDESYLPSPTRTPASYARHRELRKGAVVTRRAEEAHRLVLPPDIPYTMMLFTTGPHRRAWGFWYPDGWHDAKRHVADREGQSVHVNEEK